MQTHNTQLWWDMVNFPDIVDEIPNICEKKKNEHMVRGQILLCFLPFYFPSLSYSGAKWISFLSFHKQGDFPFGNSCAPLGKSPVRQTGSQDEELAGGTPPSEEVGHFLPCKDDWWSMETEKQAGTAASSSMTAWVNVWLALPWLTEVSLTLAVCCDS